jgi:hypothetical protein
VTRTRGFDVGAVDVRTAVGEGVTEGFGVATSATTGSGLGVETVSAAG